RFASALREWACFAWAPFDPRLAATLEPAVFLPDAFCPCALWLEALAKAGDGETARAASVAGAAAGFECATTTAVAVVSDRTNAPRIIAALRIPRPQRATRMRLCRSVPQHNAAAARRFQIGAEPVRPLPSFGPDPDACPDRGSPARDLAVDQQRRPIAQNRRVLLLQRFVARERA